MTAAAALNCLAANRCRPLIGILCLAIAASASAQRPSSGGYAREMAEHDHALENREQGQIKSLNILLPRAHRAAGRSEYIGVESGNAGITYRFKFQRPDGRLVWVDMDGRTGAILSVR